MSAATLLDRLQAVRQAGPGRWLAKCPAHEDRSPSLSIRELDDGRILLHDFGHCQTSDILAALGLEMSALFPERLPGVKAGAGYAPSHSKIPARDLLEVVSEEVTVVAIIAADFLGKKSITETDWTRLATAAGRINRVRDYCHG